MPILDKIKEAERIAEESRVEARKEVSELISETNIKNAEISANMIDEAKIDIKKLNEENDKYISELTTNSIDECKKINDNNERLAKINLDETVEFILKKVIDS